MKIITPVYKAKEKISGTTDTSSAINTQSMQAGVQELYKSLTDPNRKPVMETFTELE